MTLIQLLVFIVILGLALYLVERFIPMAEPFRILLRVIVVIVIIAILLKFVGVDLGVPTLWTGGGLALPALR
jgi:hypothetical protein